jgi:hypothetical protein
MNNIFQIASQIVVSQIKKFAIVGFNISVYSLTDLR